MVSLLAAPTYTLKISLRFIEPPIWRRVRVRGDVRLDQLHDIIQVAMGWLNCHMHDFTVDKVRYGEPEPDLGDAVLDEMEYTLSQVAPKKGAKIRYEYDFGDSWLHEIKVEKIETSSPDDQPICLDGARNCPPEDVGGVWGYSELVKAMTKPKSKRAKELISWLGGKFDPELFDLAAINRDLRQFKYR
jgi:hypothetical protein